MKLKTLKLLPALIWLTIVPQQAWAEYTNISQETKSTLALVHKKDNKAMEKLGDIYAEGQGVEQDLDEAMTWYAMASKYGNNEATDKLWKLEGHAERKVKRVKKSHKYNKQATHDLCAYLFLTTQKGTSSLLPPAAVPEGIKTTPASGGLVTIEEYKPAVVMRYLKKGADPRVAIRIEDIDRPLGGTGHILSPYAMVSRKHDFKSLEAFLTHGCCINQHGNALLAEAFCQLDRGDAKIAKKILKYLTERGLNLNIRSDWSSTRLIDCACVDYAKGVTYLVQKGQSPDAELDPRYILEARLRNASAGDRSLGMAVRNKQLYTINALIKAKADINYVRKGKTVLDEALAASGEKIEKSKTYEEEFKRLEAIAFGDFKPSKKSPLKLHRIGNTNNINVAHLLRLAGAKTAAELGETAGNQ